MWPTFFFTHSRFGHTRDTVFGTRATRRPQRRGGSRGKRGSGRSRRRSRVHIDIAASFLAYTNNTRLFRNTLFGSGSCGTRSAWCAWCAWSAWSAWSACSTAGHICDIRMTGHGRSVQGESSVLSHVHASSQTDTPNFGYLFAYNYFGHLTDWPDMRLYCCCCEMLWCMFRAISNSSPGRFSLKSIPSEIKA